MKVINHSSMTKKQGVRSNRLPVSVSGQITLLTDFGTTDYYVGAVKGVILSINPAARIIDISHEISRHDIEAAAFVLVSCYQSFSPGTVHVGVVDPGVGSSRRAIVARAGKHYLVGPDNGIFSYVFDREPERQIIHLTSQEYFRQPVSMTFHGRDIFAPVAAALSKGVSLEAFGEEIRDEVRLKPLAVEVTKKGKVKGRILHIDHFGNCVTNIDRQVFADRDEQAASLSVNDKRIRSIQSSYTAENGKHKLFAIWGSAGFLEISSQNRSAAKLIKATRGDEVVVEFET